MDSPAEHSLADVRISERGEEDVLMLIETNSKKDILISVFLFLAVIVSPTCAGFFGPPLIHTDRTRYSLTPNTMNVLHHSIPGVVPQNQFLVAKLAFEQANPTEDEAHTQVIFNYLLIFQADGREVRRESGSFHEAVHFAPRQELSEEIPFFFDRFLRYDRVEVRIDFSGFELLTDAVIIWQVGDINHLKFQLWLRATFGVACVVSFVVFWMRLKSIPRVNWTVEQTATLVLNLLALFGINPLFLLYAYYPSLLQEVLNEFEERAFKSFIFLFILLVVDNLKHEKKSFFLPPKMAFFVVLFLVEVIPLWVMPFGLEITGHNIIMALKTVRLLLYVIFAGWYGYIFYHAWISVDQVEHFVMYVYGFVFTIAILASASEVLSTFLSEFVNETALFTLRFSSLYGFVLLMVFCHWPYEYQIDEIYDNPENEEGENGLLESDG